MPIDQTAVARAVGITTQYKDLRQGAVLNLPQRIYVMAQGNSAGSFSTTKFRIQSAKDVIDAGAGFGSPAHAIARQLFPENGDGVGTVPVTMALLEDGYDATPAEGTITPSGTQTARAQYRAVISKVKSAPYTVAAAASVADRCAALTAAINGTLDMPVIATNNGTSVGLVSKWAGPTANGIYVEIEGAALGTTWTVVQPTGGLVNPDITDALAQIGNIWETMLLNALDIADTDVLDQIQEFGEGRWGELVRKPFMCFTGNTAASVSNATAVTATRTNDRVNAQLVAPGSRNLPHVVAARQLARIARRANNNPPAEYADLKATGLVPGTDAEQWDHPTSDQAVKAGSSTVDVVDGVIRLANTVTMFAPAGDPLPAYRFVNDIVKLQNIIYNISLIFETDEWRAAVLIPDNQPTTEPFARKPKNAKSQVYAMLDSLGLAAIISEPTFAKKNTTTGIDGSNPRRLNVSTTVKISGNAGIIDVGLNFGFYVGTPAVLG